MLRCAILCYVVLRCATFVLHCAVLYYNIVLPRNTMCYGTYGIKIRTMQTVLYQCAEEAEKMLLSSFSSTVITLASVLSYPPFL